MEHERHLERFVDVAASGTSQLLCLGDNESLGRYPADDETFGRWGVYVQGHNEHKKI